MQAQATFKMHSARMIHTSLFVQVNQLLQISKLNGTADDEIIPPTGTYIMTTALLGAAGAVTNTLTDLSAPAIAVVTAAGNDPNLVTISVTDFNQFRLLVGEAVDILDQKIDEILNIQNLTC